MAKRGSLRAAIVLAATWIAFGQSAATQAEEDPAGTPAPSAQLAEPLVVIVHPSRAAALSRPTLRQIFLRRKRLWPDGARITPVNHPAGSIDREAFSEALFARPSRGHLQYWNRAYFHGLLPPMTLDSDRAVVLFVAQRPDAIGYVRADAIDDSVAVAARLEGESTRSLPDE